LLKSALALSYLSPIQVKESKASDARFGGCRVLLLDEGEVLRPLFTGENVDDLHLQTTAVIVIEKSPDALDEVQFAGERELVIRTLDWNSNLLRNVKAALGRMANQSYGICLRCDEQIKPKRLDAVPWTKYCIRCQEAADRQEFAGESSEGTETLLAA
jgi:DnaK suppressor protein